MKKFKAGIVGCGRIFPMHAIPLQKMENVDLVAVCDIKEERAIEKAEQFNCNYYQKYEEMIAREDLDVVHICTPHYLHPIIANFAAQAGVNILTEKPMSITYEDAVKMINTAEQNDVTLGVIFQTRYNPGSQLIKQTLKSGELGKILSGTLSLTWDKSDEHYSKIPWKGTWDKEGGGVVIDQAIHIMDLMRWFVDEEINYVDAYIDNREHKTIEVEDVAEGAIKFKNDVIASFHVLNYYKTNAPVKIELICENGRVNMVSARASIKFNNGKEIIADEDPSEIIDYGDGVKSYWGVSHGKQIANYYQSLAQGVRPDITGREAIKTQRMICAIYESGKSRKRVYL